MAAFDGVGQLVGKRLAEQDVDVADIPFVKSFRRESVSQLEPEVDLVADSESISEIRGIVGVVIVIAVVAEEQSHPIALCIQGVDTEGVVAVDGLLLTRGVD